MSQMVSTVRCISAPMSVLLQWELSNYHIVYYDTYLILIRYLVLGEDTTLGSTGVGGTAVLGVVPEAEIVAGTHVGMEVQGEN
jgi:hypothetical protein